MRFVIPFLVLTVIAAQAQAVRDCGGFEAEAQNIAEPWEANTRIFANGDVRIAVLDTIEPAAAAFHLLVLSPPFDEVGGRQCRVVSASENGLGFAGLTLDDLVAQYSAEVGLTLAMRLQRFDPETGGFAPGGLAVTINQATGAVSATTLVAQ